MRRLGLRCMAVIKAHMHPEQYRGILDTFCDHDYWATVIKDPSKWQWIESWKRRDQAEVENACALTACSKSFITNPRPLQPQSSPLLKLPVELHLEIFNYLDRLSLLQLTQTCVVLHDSVIPFFLEHIVLDWHSMWNALRANKTLLEILRYSKEAADEVRHLEVYDQWGTYTLLIPILPHTPKLESLVSRYVLIERDGIIDAIDLVSIGRLLSPVQNTLTRLVLSYAIASLSLAEATDDSLVWETPSGVFRWCSLVEMTALKYLEAPFLLLFGPFPERRVPSLGEVSPPNLVNLKIATDLLDLEDKNEWTDRGREKALEAFLQDADWEMFTPDLQVFIYYRFRKTLDDERVWHEKEMYLVEFTRDNSLSWGVEDSEVEAKAKERVEELVFKERLKDPELKKKLIETYTIILRRTFHQMHQVNSGLSA
ncbi:hypothetical protein DM02DRAFT_711325 [Periconia macrospinosa]|uniref:F-box domain-containing protein n=1 Tax=Periconia macrospinosa TaxID=97972 RepID=A0A2V1DN94_9PLEO|nr:hypothetical protein DM02DRAFT_711325 [Periconia macrospinosa]